MKLYMCLIHGQGGSLILISHCKMEVGIEFHLSLSNGISLPDCAGILPGRYKITSYIRSEPAEINGRKLKLHSFQICKS